MASRFIPWAMAGPRPRTARCVQLCLQLPGQLLGRRLDGGDAYLLDQNGGDINGKTIALVYHNSAYGKEPIRTLEELAKKHGFKLTLMPVDHPGQEQKSQWLQIRREKPDYVLMWGWGVMNQVAIQEAVNIRFPMENFIGIWWSGSENDVKARRRQGQWLQVADLPQPWRSDYPVYDDIQKHVVDAGKAAGAGDQVGTVLYNRGMYAAMLAAEAIEEGPGNPRHRRHHLAADARRHGSA